MIGLPIDQIETPALWVDLNTMEGNIQMLAQFFQTAGVGWRPHTKGIKIPAIAKMLVQAGAIGITCAKLSEAEMMAENGIRDILIANQVVGDAKLTRLCELNRSSDVMVAVDNLAVAQALSKKARETGVRVRVVIEVNIGMDRAGVQPGQPVVDLACELAQLPGLRFSGLMGWEGQVVAMQDQQEKRRACEEAVNQLLASAEACRRVGLAVPIVSCGGSGSFRITAAIPGVTEIQAGGCILGDVTYTKWGAGTIPSLFVLTSVTSRPTADRAIVDAGRKAINPEISMPEVKDRPELKPFGFSAEHGYLRIQDGDLALQPGEKLNLVVGYGDLTVFLHDRLIGVRNGVVETVWPVLGRGKME